MKNAKYKLQNATCKMQNPKLEIEKWEMQNAKMQKMTNAKWIRGIENGKCEIGNWQNGTSKN